jgi:hypothetical protein
MNSAGKPAGLAAAPAAVTRAAPDLPLAPAADRPLAPQQEIYTASRICQ